VKRRLFQTCVWRHPDRLPGAAVVPAGLGRCRMGPTATKAVPPAGTHGLAWPALELGLERVEPVEQRDAHAPQSPSSGMAPTRTASRSAAPAFGPFDRPRCHA